MLFILNEIEIFSVILNVKINTKASLLHLSNSQNQQR